MTRCVYPKIGMFLIFKLGPVRDSRYIVIANSKLDGSLYLLNIENNKSYECDNKILLFENCWDFSYIEDSDIFSGCVSRSETSRSC